MGLDTVELVLAFEEEFGIEITDKTAEQMVTVGDVYNFFRTKLKTVPPKECLTQRVFYKLRRALIENYGLQRHQILRDTRLSSLLSVKEIEEGWPYLEVFAELECPNFETAKNCLSATKVLTVEEIVHALIDLNYQKLQPNDLGDEDIYRRIVNVTVQQLNVRREEVMMHTSFTKDLGAD